MIETQRVRSCRRRVACFATAAVMMLWLGTLEHTTAQTVGNSVTGYVFGVDRKPVADVHVELLNDLSQTMMRTRTNASGHYAFYGLPAGRFVVRVMPLGTDYENQEQGFEIDNFTRGSGSDRRVTGLMSEQRDFYLRPRKGVIPGVTGAIFAQEVPEPARKLYRQGTEQLAQKKRPEAFNSLKSAIETFPKYFDALELLGIEYVREGHFDAAGILLAAAVEVNPRAYKSWHGIAIAQSKLGDNTAALASVEKAVEINPIEPQSLLLSGALLRKAKRYLEAEKRLVKAKEVFEGTSGDVHWELAQLYANDMQRYRDAARELRLFLKARRDYPDAEKQKIEKLIVVLEEKEKAKPTS